MVHKSGYLLKHNLIWTQLISTMFRDLKLTATLPPCLWIGTNADKIEQIEDPACIKSMFQAFVTYKYKSFITCHLNDSSAAQGDIVIETVLSSTEWGQQLYQMLYEDAKLNLNFYGTDVEVRILFIPQSLRL